MSYLVLARKYRPQTFDQVVKQEHVTRTLSNAVDSGRLAHAILFSGPRGTGKTTVARILAKAMNCLEGPRATPCNQCRSCREITNGNAADVFEIDGASNNSVDQVRELRESVKYKPAFSANKIYIIDEVHMLSMAAFNALLKTLEEPPPHVMFFFATTEVHKIPITILSRCQRHDLRRIDLASLTAHMSSLCEQEGVAIENESLELIAREAGGSMRDSLSILDQVISCSQEKVIHDSVIDILGVVDRKDLFDITAAVLQRDLSAVLDRLTAVHDRGQDMRRLYENLVEMFRNLMMVKLGGHSLDRLVDLPAHEIDRMTTLVEKVSLVDLNRLFDILFAAETGIRYTAQPRLALEMVFFRLFQAGPALGIGTLIRKLDKVQQQLASGDHVGQPADLSARQPMDTGSPVAAATDAGEPGNTGNTAPEDRVEPPPVSPQTAPREASAAVSVEDPNAWDLFRDKVAEDHRSIGGSLARCQPLRLTTEEMVLEVGGKAYDLKMLERRKKVLEEAATSFFNSAIAVTLTAAENQEDNRAERKKEANQREQEALEHPLVADAIEIFNGSLMGVNTEPQQGEKQ